MITNQGLSTVGCAVTSNQSSSRRACYQNSIQQPKRNCRHDEQIQCQALKPILFDDHDKPRSRRHAAQSSPRRFAPKPSNERSIPSAPTTISRCTASNPCSPISHPQHHGNGRQLRDLRALSKTHPPSGARLPAPRRADRLVASTALTILPIRESDQ